MADAWVLATDASSGGTYYFNETTQETSWEVPEGVDPATVRKQAVWSMIKDAGSFYFYNNVTGDSVWEKPDDFDGIDMAETEGIEEGDEEETKGTDAGDGAKKFATKWLAVVDEDSGATYYYNNNTGDCQWDKPDDFDGQDAPGASKEEMAKILKAKLKLAALDSETRNKIKAAQEAQRKAKESGKFDWVECYDPSSDSFYYVNKTTNTTTWEKPENYMMAADDEMMHAVVKIQCLFRGKIARGEVVIKKKKKELWIEVKDEGTGDTYYYNNETGECQWEKPDDFAGGSSEGASKEQMEKILKAKLKLAALDSETRNKIKAAQEAQRKAKEAGKFSWVECYDPSSDAFYYTNKDTNETTWEKPENYIMAADDEMMHAVVKIQCMFRGKIARGEVVIKKKKVWEEIIDQETGNPYYYNSKTEEITWDRPEELGGPIVDPAVAAARKDAAEGSLVKALSLKLKEARMDDETRNRLKAARERQKKAIELGLVGKWVECYDPGNDGFYYYNPDSGETTWDKPANYVMAADDELMQAVVKIQCMYRARLAKRRAEGMVGKARNITQTQHQDALERMKRLNEEEMEMKRQMEELKKQREFKSMNARQKQKAIEEAKRRAQEELNEKEREDARAEKQRGYAEARKRKRREKEQAERDRKERRRRKLVEIEEKTRLKREAEKKAKEEAERKRKKDREIRQMKRDRAARLEREQRKKDHAAWKAVYAKALQDEAARKKERDSAAHQEFMQRRADQANREKFVARREKRQDAAIQTVWDAAMHGVTRPRANVLLNLAVADSVSTAQQEEDGGAPAEVIAGAKRSYSELSAGVGTAPQSRALFNVDVSNEVGESPMHVAAWRGHHHVVEALIAQGADVNLIDTVYSKATPLHEAARGGWRQVVRVLVAAGADLSKQDCSGDTPLHIACRKGDVGLASMLLDADADKVAAHTRNFKNQVPHVLAKKGGIKHLMAGFAPPEPAPAAKQIPAVVEKQPSRRRSSVARRRSSVARRRSISRR